MKKKNIKFRKDGLRKTLKDQSFKDRNKLFQIAML